MKRIGTDVSIAECRRSGYMVMDYPAKLLKKGILDKELCCTFSMSNPEAWNDAGKPHLGMGDQLWYLSPHDHEFSFNDLLSRIEDEKNYKCVASCCDWENCKPELDNPNEYDMLHLASDISAAIGLI